MAFQSIVFLLLIIVSDLYTVKVDAEIKKKFWIFFVYVCPLGSDLLPLPCRWAYNTSRMFVFFHLYLHVPLINNKFNMIVNK